MESCEENNNSNRGCNLRVFNLLERRRLAPLNFNSGGSGGGGGNGGDDNDAIVTRKLLYRKLPQQHLLNLSVLKLDGSLFGKTPSISLNFFLFFDVLLRRA